MHEIAKHTDIDSAFNYHDQEATKSLNQGGRYYLWGSTKKPPSDMTKKQRGALHIWCDMFANALNDAGYPRKKVLVSTGEIVEVDWNMLTFKEDVYKPLLEALTKKTSTEEQDTVNPSQVADHINRHFAQNKGLSVAWPSNRGGVIRYE